MGIYKSGRTGEYCVVNKGTTFKNLNNWKNNLQQPFGFSADMKNSIAKAKRFVKKIKKSTNEIRKEITFVGYSKGGAEAAANAVATNKNCILFNPATVNLSAYGLSEDNYHASMTAYIVEGEILSLTMGWMSKPIDNVVYLPSQYKANYGEWYEVWKNAKERINSLDYPIQNHLMDAVIKALKEKGYK